MCSPAPPPSHPTPLRLSQREGFTPRHTLRGQGIPHSRHLYPPPPVLTRDSPNICLSHRYRYNQTVFINIQMPGCAMRQQRQSHKQGHTTRTNIIKLNGTTHPHGGRAAKLRRQQGLPDRTVLGVLGYCRRSWRTSHERNFPVRLKQLWFLYRTRHLIRGKLVIHVYMIKNKTVENHIGL